MATTHIATIGTAPDVVEAGNYDLTIYRASAAEVGYMDDTDKPRIEYVADGDSVHDTDLTMALSEDVEAAIAEADEWLTQHGYTRLTDWSASDNALYAEVEASVEEQFEELAPVAAQIDAMMSRRDLLVRSLMQEPAAAAPRKRIAQTARLSEPRLYQIRDGRR